jgi:hypothetical protein
VRDNATKRKATNPSKKVRQPARRLDPPIISLTSNSINTQRPGSSDALAP